LRYGGGGIMKYQEALNRIIAKYYGVNNDPMLEDDLKTLQELVDKATPKITNIGANCIEAKCEHNPEDRFYDLFILASELMDCKDYNDFLNRAKYLIRCIKEEQTLKGRKKDEILKHIDRCILYHIYAEMGLL
jgi:hypothetical protein